MAIPDINLSQFIEATSPPPGAQQEDILETGNVARVEEYIERAFPRAITSSLLVNYTLTLHCISQASLSTKKSADICHSRFTSRFIQMLRISQESAAIGLAAINSLKFGVLSKFKPLCEQAEYLVKPKYHSRFSIFGTRLSHHLNKSLGNLPVMSKGAAYVSLGISLFATGVIQSTILVNPEDVPQRNVRASLLFSSGITLISVPFFEALIKCRQTTP